MFDILFTIKGPKFKFEHSSIIKNGGRGGSKEFSRHIFEKLEKAPS